MRQPSPRRPSREQWQRKAPERAEDHRFLRTALARISHERDRLRPAHRETQERLRQHEAQAPGLVVPHKAAMVWRALRLFGAVRISLRAVSRVFQFRAAGGALTQAPGPQTGINGLMRRAIVRSDATYALRGRPVRAAPFRNGLLWMIALSLGLGTGTIVAVVALEAQHHALAPGAIPLARGRCLGGSVAQSWTGATIADLRRRLIAQLGRPAASRTAGGGDRRTAVDFLEAQGLGSPGLDDIAPAGASMRKRSYHEPPACATVVSACGRVSSPLKHTLLACVGPPTVRTNARFMPGHRLGTWADRVLHLSPSGGAKTGATLATLRAGLHHLPACTALITRLRSDAKGLRACQPLVKVKGRSHATLAPGAPLLATMPSAAVRRACHASLVDQLATATTLGLAPIGFPISSEAIASLVGVAKRHGGGETQEASRMALRLPACCGVPTREEAQQVLAVRVARPRECTAPVPSLTTPRRTALGHPERLEGLLYGIS